MQWCSGVLFRESLLDTKTKSQFFFYWIDHKRLIRVFSNFNTHKEAQCKAETHGIMYYGKLVTKMAQVCHLEG